MQLYHLLIHRDHWGRGGEGRGLDWTGGEGRGLDWTGGEGRRGEGRGGEGGEMAICPG